MKTTFAIPFAVALAFATATRSVAVPPRPVDATSVTLLPADGTPESLRKRVAAFGRKIADVNNDAGTKRERLRTQMADGFERAIAAAQSSGDIDAVLALKAAKEKFDALTTSDIPMVKNAIDFREKKTAEIETARLADAMKAAKEFNDELEKSKKDETTKGNFETAKALSDYQKKLAAWAQSVRATTPASQPARPVPTSIPRPQTPQPVRQTTTTQTVSVYATSANGASIGFAKAGDVFKIQYAGGHWMTGYEIEESPDSARLRRQDDRCVLVRRTDPASRLATIPANTKQRAFSYMVAEDGEYALRVWDGMNDYRQGHFNDNRGSVRYSVTKISSAGSPSIAPALNPAPSPFSVRPQGQFAPVETKTVYASATQPYGGVVGELKAGDRFVVRYLGGKWRAGGLEWSPDVSPDSDPDDLVRTPNAAAIMRTSNLPENYLENERALSGTTYDRIPARTATRPFEFTVPEDGVYRIRIAEPGWARDYRDNNGTVSYEVKIYRQGAR